MNRTQKVFGVFFIASIILWVSWIILIVEFVLLAFANALIPGILYDLVGAIFVFAVLSTYAASAIREQALKAKSYSSHVPKTAGWVCGYCQTINSEKSAKCVNCGAPKKVS
jgi:hypothetical protein